jgi:LysM repeat protein
MTLLRRAALAIIVLLIVSLAMPAPTFAQEGGKHVVQAGENLYRIALKYGLTVNQLAAANGITDVSRVYVGQVLVIPGAEQTAQQPASAPATTNGVYIVQRGDTVKSIAQRFGVSWEAVVSVNRLANPNMIYPGQQLVIPGAGQPAAEQPAADQTVSQPVQEPANNAATGRTHVVQPGQGLGQIARLYGVSWIAIARLNNISNPNLIHAGMVLKIPDAGSPEAEVAAPGAVAPGAPVGDGKVILVILSEQMAYAYEGGQLLRQSRVSTGLPGTPTVTGEFQIYVKYQAQLMTGPGYYLPNVPYVMYFYQGYGLHGTYWHSNFGQPMSHGCVNLPTPEAEWLFGWAPVGTRVVVRYY